MGGKQSLTTCKSCTCVWNQQLTSQVVHYQEVVKCLDNVSSKMISHAQLDAIM